MPYFFLLTLSVLFSAAAISSEPSEDRSVQITMHSLLSNLPELTDRRVAVLGFFGPMEGKRDRAYLYPDSEYAALDSQFMGGYRVALDFGSLTAEKGASQCAGRHAIVHGRVVRKYGAPMIEEIVVIYSLEEGEGAVECYRRRLSED